MLITVAVISNQCVIERFLDVLEGQLGVPKRSGMAGGGFQDSQGTSGVTLGQQDDLVALCDGYRYRARKASRIGDCTVDQSSYVALV